MRPFRALALASVALASSVATLVPLSALADVPGTPPPVVPPPAALPPPGPQDAPDARDPHKHDPPVDPVKAAAAKLAELEKHGAEACSAGDIDDGLPSLRAAWALHQDADLAVTLATCEIKAQDWPSAADHLAFALRNKDDPEQRKALEATFLNVRARVGAVKVSVSVDGADVFVGDRFAGTTPLPGEVYVPPGKSRISTKKTGYGEIEGTVDVPAQGTATLSLDLAGEGAIATSHQLPKGRSRTPAYVMGAIGLVGAGAGAALWAAGFSKGAAADSLLTELQTTSSQPCVSGTAGCQTLKSLRQQHDTLVNVGTGVVVASGALLGATLIYALWATAAPAPATGSIRSIPSIRFAPAASPQGGSFMLEGSF
jgi:hypothetical protein